MSDQTLRRAHAAMIHSLLIPNGIRYAPTLQAMQRVPRHRFMPLSQRQHAYEDRALPIGEDEVSLSPLTLARILQALRLKGTENILEVGTGSGYLTALLIESGAYVYSLESCPTLAGRAADTLSQMGYQRVDLHIGDGSQGLADMAPFDAIVVTAAVPRIPRSLAIQLKHNGRMIIPLIEGKQHRLRLVQRQADRWQARTICYLKTTLLRGRYGSASDNSCAGI